MKNKLKGFTLIELIIVMAILTILMAGIMQMFKPIRETYVDSTLYESQRTSQNGVVQYITESVRYATDLGMYTKDKVTNINGAVDAFAEAYLEKNGVDMSDPDYPTKLSNAKDYMSRNAEVIIIDNTVNGDNTTPYYYGKAYYTGRILRRKIDGDLVSSDSENIASTADKCRLALGAAYYGNSSYSITFGITQDGSGVGDASDGIKVTVASNATYGIRSSSVISNSGLVLCKNLCAPINGMFDTENYNSGSASGDNTKVYIVYINDKYAITA